VNWVIPLTLSRAAGCSSEHPEIKGNSTQFACRSVAIFKSGSIVIKNPYHKFCYSYVRTAIVLIILEITSTLNGVMKISYNFNLFNVLAVIQLQMQWTYHTSTFYLQNKKQKGSITKPVVAPKTEHAQIFTKTKILCNTAV
jgi:hypothetical protein